MGGAAAGVVGGIALGSPAITPPSFTAREFFKLSKYGMVSQGLAELRLRNSSNLVMANTFTEVHRKDGLVCAVGNAAAVSVECAGVDGLEVWETLMDGEFARNERSAAPSERRERHLVPRHGPHLVRSAAPAAWRHGL